MVFDVTILQVNQKLYVTEVDFGRRSLYRQFGLLWLADLLSIKEDLVSWSYVQRLPESIGSFKGDLKLKALKEQIEDMPPVDVADIIEELEAPHREAVLSQLDSEDASDALEEIEPNVQREILSTMDAETAAKLIGLMTPAQAKTSFPFCPTKTSKNFVYLGTWISGEDLGDHCRSRSISSNPRQHHRLADRNAGGDEGRRRREQLCPNRQG